MRNSARIRFSTRIVVTQRRRITDNAICDSILLLVMGFVFVMVRTRPLVWVLVVSRSPIINMILSISHRCSRRLNRSRSRCRSRSRGRILSLRISPRIRVRRIK